MKNNRGSTPAQHQDKPDKKWDLVDVSELISHLNDLENQATDQRWKDLPPFLRGKNVPEELVVVSNILLLIMADKENHYVIVGRDQTVDTGRIYVCEARVYLKKRKKSI